MTPATSPLVSSLDPADLRPVDTAADRTLLLFSVSSILWLLVGACFELIHLTQLHTPGFFAGHEFSTFGRMQAAAESVLLYGWAANAAFASSIWILARLGGVRPRSRGLAFIGCLFWNLGLSAGVIGILAGDLTGWAYLQLPGYVLPLLILAAAAIGACALFAFVDRRRPVAYAAQWYAAASLFTLPWFLSVAFVMLYLNPGRIISQSIIASWIGSGLLLLWLGPTVLALAYYLIPKLEGRAIRHYALALGAFWTLFVFGSWAGTRSLAGGPVPVWVPSVGIGASLVLVIHYLIVGDNLRGALGSLKSGVAMKFLALSLACYVLGGLVDVAGSLRSSANWLQFTHFAEARWMLLLFGALTPAALACLYIMVPHLTGRPWAAEGLVTMHWRAASLGVLLLVVGLVGGAFQQSVSLAKQELPFAAMPELFKPWLLCATGGVFLQFLGAMFLFVNLLIQARLPQLASGAKTATPVSAS